jgi:hypothetical protein
MPQNFLLDLCACPTGCVYESDNFDRNDDTDLGAKWTETAGDWDINGNRLRIVATADAKITCDTLAPAASLKYLVSVSVTLGTDGDVARVFVDDSAFFAELERITSTCGRLRLYDGATCKGSVGVSLGGYTRLVMCVEAAKIHVGTGGSPMLTVPATPASSIVALGTGACTGTVYFEDFSLSKHADDDATCPACGSEGCTWFSDNGCASGSLSAVDYTTTGTWAYGYHYGSCLKCTSDGTLAVVPTHPRNPKGTIKFSTNPPDGSVTVYVRLYYDASTNVYAEYWNDSTVPFDPIHGNWRARFFAGGTQYGPAIYCNLAMGDHITLCYDGTSIIGGTTQGSDKVYIPGAPETCQPKIEVVGLSATYPDVNVFVLTAYKHGDDVAGCQECGTPTCTTCLPGTFTNSARVVLANLTSVDYGCKCSDVTILLYATASGCSWTGTATGPCSSGTWTATATVSAVTGGYKLSVSVSNTTGVSALFEETVLGGLPDCSSAFDGDIPLVQSAGSLHCTMEAATLDFRSPAP